MKNTKNTLYCLYAVLTVTNSMAMHADPTTIALHLDVIAHANRVSQQESAPHITLYTRDQLDTFIGHLFINEKTDCLAKLVADRLITESNVQVICEQITANKLLQSDDQKAYNNGLQYLQTTPRKEVSSALLGITLQQLPTERRQEVVQVLYKAKKLPRELFFKTPLELFVSAKQLHEERFNEQELDKLTVNILCSYENQFDSATSRLFGLMYLEKISSTSLPEELKTELDNIKNSNPTELIKPAMLTKVLCFAKRWNLQAVSHALIGNMIQALNPAISIPEDLGKE